MIRVLQAHTQEMDDPAEVAADLLRQLDLPSRLPGRSVGLLFCYLDFLRQGVAAKLCERLPFPVIGCTTQGIALPGIHDSLLLSLVVLSSEEHIFLAGVSEPLDRDADERLRRLYRRLSLSLTGKPSLMIAFAPEIPDLDGDLVANSLDGASDGVPLVGSIALDVTTKNRNAQTVLNGMHWGDRLALLLIQGPLQPVFFLQELHKAAISRDESLVTAAEGNMILRINHLPAVLYLEKLGLVRNGEYDTLFAIPFFLQPPDKARSVNACRAISPEGALYCLSPVPQGSRLRFGTVPERFVLDSVNEMTAAVRRAATAGDFSLLLFFSCFTRNVALGDPLEEMALLRKGLAEVGLPFVFAYAGGEFCPRALAEGQDADRRPAGGEMPGAGGTFRNEFLQYSLVGCLF